MEDLILFEKKHLKSFKTNDEKIENYYKIFEQSDFKEFLMKSFHTLQTAQSKDIFFQKELKRLTTYFDFNVNFSNFTVVRSASDLIILYLSFFITKSFWLIDCKDEKSIFHYSDLKANNIQNDLENFLRFVKVILNEQNKYRSNNELVNSKNQKNRKLAQYLLNKLLEKKLINAYNLKNNFKNKKIFSLDQENFIKPFPIIHESPFDYFNKDGDKFIYSNHYSEVYCIFRKNSESGAIFETQDDSSISKLCQENYYLDINLLEILFLKMLKKLNIRLEDIEINHNRLIKKLKNCKNTNELEIKSLSQTLSNYNTLYLIKKLLDLKSNLKTNFIKIYLPFLFDFRSRFYYLSDLSPTFNKIFRYCLHFGEYETFTTREHFLLSNVNEIIDKKIYFLDMLKKQNLSNKELSIKRACIWYLISIGEVFKTTYPDQVENGVHIDNFIKKGVDVLNIGSDSFKDLDKDDYMKIIFTEYVMNEISSGLLIKRPISKDATASCFQHSIKLLGFSSENALKWCNLSSKDRWYDTYIYIINTFKKEIKLKHLKLNDFDNLFNRKLKRIIMTQNYSAKEKKCWEYFLDAVDLSKFNEKEKNEINDIFKKFYIFLENNNSLLMYSPQTLTDYFLKGEKIIKFSDSTVNLTYNKIKSTQKEVKFEKKRFTYSDKIILKEENLVKMKSSIKPNYIHSLDGYLAFWIKKHDKIITIHDCFIIDYLHTSYLIAKLNEGMRLFFHDIKLDSRIRTDDLFSIFVAI